MWISIEWGRIAWQSGARLTRCEADVIKWYTYDVNVDLILDRAVRASLDADDVIKWYTYDVNVDLILTERWRRTRCWGRCYKMIHIWCECWPYRWQSGARLTRSVKDKVNIHIICVSFYNICLSIEWGASLDAEADVIKWYTYDVNVDLICWQSGARLTRCWGRCYKMIHIWCECWPYPWQSGARLTRCWGRCYKMIHIWCECWPYPSERWGLTRCWVRCYRSMIHIMMCIIV